MKLLQEGVSVHNFRQLKASNKSSPPAETVFPTLGKNKKKWTEHWLKQVFLFHPLPTISVVSTCWVLSTGTAAQHIQTFKMSGLMEAVIKDWFSESPITAPSFPAPSFVDRTKACASWLTATWKLSAIYLPVASPWGGDFLGKNMVIAPTSIPTLPLPNLGTEKPLHDRLILLSFTKQLWPVEILNQSSAAKCILAALLSTRISRDVGGMLHNYL